MARPNGFGSWRCSDRRILAIARGIAPFLFIFGLSACATNSARTVVQSRPATITGLASWYGRQFQDDPTASGRIFYDHELTAASPSLPFGCVVEVTDLDTDRTVTVRIDDRGPHVAGRIIDLSKAAAARLGMLAAGVSPVKVTILSAD